jgi:hypothetical protein
MKKKILTCVVSMLIALTGFTAFGQQDKKAEKARKNEAKAKKDLKLAKADSAADYNKFKADAEAKIDANQKKIAELKAKKSSESKEIKAKYDKKVLALEVENNKLKKKAEGASDTETSMWTAFKRQFNKDMEALGQSIKDVQVDTK